MTGRKRLNAYVGSTAVAGLLVVALAVPGAEWRAVVLGFLAVAVAESLSTTMRDDAHVSLSNIVVLVVLVAAGPDVVVLAALGAVPPILRRATDQRWARVSFNASQLALSAAGAAVTYRALTVVTGSVFPEWRALLSVLAAAIVYSVVNHALVAGVISLSSPDGFRVTFRTVGPSLAMQVPYVGIAVLTVVVLERASLWALALMAVPALIARYGLVAFQRLDESYDEMVTSMVDAIEIKDLYTRGHSERVSKLSVQVAEEIGLPYDERRLIRYAALLHDVGKIGVPLCIINKAGPLDDDEFAQITRHPAIGADILHDVDFLRPAIDVVRYHHERLDGRGYPYGVGEEELTLLVRIVTAADAFDAMTSTRSYRRAMTVEAAVTELRRCAGRQFDPDVVEALARVAEREDIRPLDEFASEAELHGHEIPVGTVQERVGTEVHGADGPPHVMPSGVRAIDAPAPEATR